MNSHTLVAWILVALSLGPSVAAQPDGTRERDPVVVGGVLATNKKATVLRAGSSKLEPLYIGRELLAGDQVETSRGGVELALNPKSPKGATAVEKRVVLDGKTQLVIAPKDAIDLELAAGSVYALEGEDLTVRAGRAVATVRVGEAELCLGKKGDLEVSVYTGVVAIAVGDTERVVKSGQSVKIDSEGSLGPSSPLRRRGARPKWVKRLRALGAKKAPFHEGFDDPALSTMEKSVGLVSGGAIARAPGSLGILIQNNKGLFTVAEGMRLRIRVRSATAGTRLYVRINTILPREENWVAEFVVPLGEEWCELEVEVADFYAGGGRKNLLRSGVTIHAVYVNPQDGGEELIYEIDDLVAYTPGR